MVDQFKISMAESEREAKKLRNRVIRRIKEEIGFCLKKHKEELIIAKGNIKDPKNPRTREINDFNGLQKQADKKLRKRIKNVLKRNSEKVPTERWP